RNSAKNFLSRVYLCSSRLSFCFQICSTVTNYFLSIQKLYKRNLYTAFQNKICSTTINFYFIIALQDFHTLLFRRLYIKRTIDHFP
ncbi:unnamed protein product, partial [Amoebophrya sp. A120]